MAEPGRTAVCLGRIACCLVVGDSSRLCSTLHIDAEAHHEQERPVQVLGGAWGIGRESLVDGMFAQMVEAETTSNVHLRCS